MSISNYINLQSSVGYILSLLGKEQARIPHALEGCVDFIYRDDDGKIIGVEVRSMVPTPMLDMMADKVANGNVPFDRFVIITPYTPDEPSLAAFQKSYVRVAKEPRWLTAKDFAKSVGLDQDIDPASAETREALKAASLQANVMDVDEEPGQEAEAETTPTQDARATQLLEALAQLQASAKASIVATAVRGETVEEPVSIELGPAEPMVRPQAPPPESKAAKARKLVEKARQGEPGRAAVPPEYMDLNRKAPVSILRDLHRSGMSVEDFFSIGKEARDVIIVLSDLKNFSSIVRAAHPEDLNKAMHTYYRSARKLLFDCGGMLDKFIGDSVLAVFNYPTQRPESFRQAVRFGANLILLGREIFSNLAMDERIDTGTRVGIATGGVWPLNIGVDTVELTFVGDKINLAARLEKNCHTDSMLLSNITYSRLQRDPLVIDKLMAREHELDPAEAKGQEKKITVWRIPSEAIPGLA